MIAREHACVFCERALARHPSCSRSGHHQAAEDNGALSWPRAVGQKVELLAVYERVGKGFQSSLHSCWLAMVKLQTYRDVKSQTKHIQRGHQATLTV